MTSNRNVIVAAALVAVGLIALAGANAQNSPGAPTAVAVVDLEVVFENLKEKADFDANLKGQRERLQGEAQGKSKAAETMRSDLDLLAPGTPAFKEKRQELAKAAIELKVWSQFEQAKLNQEAGLAIESLYRDTLDAIGRISQENGYDLVMYRESNPVFQYENLQQLLTQIGLRKALWSSDSIDITDQVVQRMNNEFSSR